MQSLDILLTKFFEPREITIIFQGNPMEISSLLVDKIRMEEYVPPLSELFYIILISSFMRPKDRKAFVNDAIKKAGLLNRVWTPSLSLLEIKRRVKETLSSLKSPNSFISIYFYLLDQYVSNPNREITINLTALIDLYLREDDFYPSKNLIKVLENLARTNNSENLVRRVKNAIINNLPSSIIEIIRGYTRLIFRKDFEQLGPEDLENIFRTNPHYLYIYLLVLTVSTIVIRLSGILSKSNMLVRIIEIILSNIPKYNNFSPYLLFLAIFSLHNLKRYDIALILNSYLLSIIHKDGRILSITLESKYSDIKHEIAKLIILLQVLSSPHLSRLLLYLARISKFSLRELNSLLLESTIKPHGIIFGIPWELLGSQDYLLRVTISAIKLYREYSVRPPLRLKLLKKFLESLDRISKKPPIDTFENQISHLATIFETQAYGNTFLTLTRKFYGTIPGFHKIINDLTKTLRRTSKKWEYALLTLYGSLIIQRAELFTSTALAQVDPSKTNLILIIDGLRYDDFITKLSNRLSEIGFKAIQIKPKISLLPSITSISRYAIISGHPPEIFNVSRSKPKEDTILTARFKNIDIFYGPIQLVERNISKKTQLKSNVAIVLSELEKSMHGASETILAHFISEYIDTILELISYTIARMKTEHKSKIVLTICSDHGLGVFHKTYELDEFTSLLQSKKILETSLDPIIKERYAIIPIKNPQMMLTIRKIYNDDEEFRTNFWLISGDSLQYKYIEFYKHSTRALTALKPANETIILFPKGYKKFLRTHGSIFHGGLSPEETFSAFGVFEFDG